MSEPGPQTILVGPNDPGRTFQRPLSPTERLWLIADRIAAPFVNQLVLEGEGELAEERWRRAVAMAAEANPGSRVVLRGMLSGCHWVDSGAAPPVRTIAAPDWDGLGPRGADFLRDPLPPTNGPTTEVVLVTGARPRVVIRTHHATMDGRGSLRFVDDVFRCLRGEPPEGARSAVVDADIARAMSPEPARVREEDCLAPTGVADPKEAGVTWRRVTVDGQVSQIVPRVAIAIARVARRYGTGRVRMDVPVDLRPHAAEVRSTANLTGMIQIEVSPDTDAPAFAAALRTALDRREEAAFVLSCAPIRSVPLWLGAWVGRGSIPRLQKRSRYITTAALSNLGRLPLDRYHGGGFRAETAFFIPPGTPSTPLFLTLCGGRDRVELTFSMPNALASGGRIEAALAEVAAALGSAG